MDFTFPTLAQPDDKKVPLTARSTVQHAGSHGAGQPAPVKAPAAASNLEHRNKGDPLLTRLLYGFLARLANVPLEKGYSQVDWMRVTRSTPQPRLRKDITLAEVKQHRSKEDAWMVFKNRVYNISPYLKYHPGGADILLKAAGRDGTSLFMKYHPWVNIDALMEKCLVGWLAEETASGAAPAAQGAGQLSTAQQTHEQPMALQAGEEGTDVAVAPSEGSATAGQQQASPGGLVLREAIAAPPPGAA